MSESHGIPYRGIEHAESWRLDPARPLSIRVTDARPPALTPAESKRWEEMTAANPRLFSGPILAVVTVDPEASELICRREGYARLVVQPQVKTGVRILAVTAVLLAKDAAGRPHVLLGRRGRETSFYGGMWELGPSGGIAPPPPTISTITEQDIRRQLAEELEEELDIVADLAAARVIGLARDDLAMSLDVAVEVDLGPLEGVLDGLTPANWEYSEVYWLPLDTARVFDDANAAEIIPPTRALFRTLGWIDES